MVASIECQSGQKAKYSIKIKKYICVLSQFSNSANIFNINIVRKDPRSIWVGGGFKVFYIKRSVFRLFVVRIGVFIFIQ